VYSIPYSPSDIQRGKLKEFKGCNIKPHNPQGPLHPWKRGGDLSFSIKDGGSVELSLRWFDRVFPEKGSVEREGVLGASGYNFLSVFAWDNSFGLLVLFVVSGMHYPFSI
jgi:hypothetical protein